MVEKIAEAPQVQVVDEVIPVPKVVVAGALGHGSRLPERISGSMLIEDLQIHHIQAPWIRRFPTQRVAPGWVGFLQILAAAQLRDLGGAL